MSRHFIAAAVAAVALAGFAAPASATETFAQSMQLNQNDTLFFTNNGDGTGSLQSYAGAIVAFSFPSATIPALELQDAYFNLSAQITQPASTAGGVIIQPLFSGDISYTRVSPFAGLSNLLTVHFTNAVLTGLNNGTTPTFLASQPGGSSTVTFSSDFLDFSSSTDRGFSYSLSGLNPALVVGSNGVIGPFSGDSTATFSVDAFTQANVPEPATWALLIFGFGGAGAMLRLKRRHAMVAA